MYPRWILIFAALLMTAAWRGAAAPASPMIPFFFEERQGNGGGPSEFVARGPGYAVRLAGAEMYIQAADAGAANSNHRAALRLRWVNARAGVELRAMDRLPGTANEFRGRDPRNWQTGLPLCARAKAERIYPGIDLVYYGNQRQLECDLILAPGADPGSIVLECEGAERLEQAREGDLFLSMAGGGHFRLCRPVLYQTLDGTRIPVDGEYRISKDNKQIRFVVGDYRREAPLIIDPVVIYSQGRGGSAAEYASDLAIDAEGNIYVTGFTASADFPATNALQTTKRSAPGDPDAFVMKVDPSGGSLIYATYLGGGLGQVGSGIAVDASNQAWVVGWTGSTDFPVLNPLQARHGGGTTDVFVAKLDASGSALLFSTFLGGRESEFSAGVGLDAAGHAYVVGTTASADFPVTNGFQSVFAGGSDAFIAKFDSTGSRLHYATYLGGEGAELGGGIAVTPAGKATVAGSTTSTNFPLVFPWQRQKQGTTDVFVARLDVAGTALDFSTFLGGRQDEFISGIATGPGGDVWLTGSTASEDFPTTNAFQTTHHSGICPFGNGSLPCTDAFLTRLSADGQALVFSTLLGGRGLENPTAALGAVLLHSASVSVDPRGYAYVVGTTFSTDFPTLNAVQPRLGRDDSDMFLAKFHPAGPLLFSTYLGEASDDIGTAVEADALGNIYLTGAVPQSRARPQAEVFLGRLFELPVTPALPSAGIEFTSAGFNAEGRFALTLSVRSNQSFAVEASTNLIHWITITNR